MSGEIERSRSNDPVMVTLLQLLATMRQDQIDMRQHHVDMVERVERIETESAENREWMTLRGFVLRYKVTPIPDTSDAGLSKLGSKIAAWHTSLGKNYRRRSGFHATYGAVNQYRTANLAEYFDQSGHSVDHGLLDRDLRR